MPVTQVAGYLSARPLADLLQRSVNPRLGGIGLGRERHVLHGLREVDAALRKADDLGCLERRLSNEKRLRIRIANVLGGQDEDAPRDELGSSPRRACAPASRAPRQGRFRMDLMKAEMMS